MNLPVTPESIYETDRLSQVRAARLAAAAHGTRIAAVASDLNMVICAGQSLANGQEATPQLSIAPGSPSAYMIGDSVRPTTFDQASWIPIGVARLNPLVATVEAQTNEDRRPLSTAQIAALPYTNSAEGESPVIAITNAVARTWLETGAPPDRGFVAVATGVSGQPIAHLVKGFDPHYYRRNVEAVAALKTLADAAGKSCSVSLIAWLQGETDYQFETPAHDYKTFLRDKFWRNLCSDIASITEQACPPALLTYVTSCGWVEDTCYAAISMAQVELSLEKSGIFCAGPSFPYPDKDGHLEADGSRWMGEMMGKVASRILIERGDWEPLYPLGIELIDRMIHIHHHVPVGPLQWSPHYRHRNLIMFTDRGYRVQDSAGFLDIVGSPRIVAPTVVAIDVGRAIDPATAHVWYADKTTHHGSGNLTDSDPARGNSISALTGAAYDLRNWCSPYYLPVGWSR